MDHPNSGRPAVNGWGSEFTGRISRWWRVVWGRRCIRAMVRTLALTSEEHAQLVREIEQAEARTSGEIYVVIAQSADEFRLVPVLWAAIFALILGWALYFTASISTLLILSLQVIGFIV